MTVMLKSTESNILELEWTGFNVDNEKEAYTKDGPVVLSVNI